MSKLEFTTEATKNMTNMLNRVYAVAHKYGDTSSEYISMLQNLLHNWANIMRLGGRITAEDELGLYAVRDDGFTYATIFHPVKHKRVCPRCNGGGVDCNCYSGWVYIPDPLLGEWSAHS